uniref:NB-ARC domains-containing protein n=1 Tax=Tanacetum cinerariifolium TaxID=118510 RepID=A0A6L2MU32_TANCI|nr:NB-ARC domains-containing protein [Tanacetum cinerariifolium]
MEIVSAIIGPVVNALTVHITQKLRNLTSFAEHVNRMKNRMKVLEGQRADIEKKMRRNSESNLEIPTRVSGWLEEVEKVKKDVDNIPSNNIGCFNVKRKYLAGRNALRVTEDIEHLIKESSDIIWSDAQIPLGRVDSKLSASTSTSTSGGNTQIWFESRDKIFNDALKFLQDDDKTRVIALCGMGGVGKTTLMKQLKVAAKDNKMFSWIVDDSNIPIEDLTRYAWGLKLLKQVFTMGNARDSTQTSVSNLKKAYLLMDGDSDDYECVKLHDLVLAFVVATVSKGGEEGCWIIHHDDFSKSSEDVNMSQSCKQISLTCKGMSEFPSEFKFPKLSLLKLIHGDESLRFPLDFYVGMDKLQVIAIEELEYPLVPTSFQFSTNLRTLCCYNLVIDDGVLKNMVKLEELYMIAFGEKACYFTDNNCNELAERSEHLFALEFEFIGNNAHLKNMAFEKLNRFKLSVGYYYLEVKDYLETDQVDMHSYQNSLNLIINREELLKSKINELFKITDALYLEVNDMNTLEDVDMESPHPQHPPRNSSFYNLRLLVVSECAELKYLFTPSVATNLSKLEYLKVSGCVTMVAVIHIENNGSNIIKFLNLKYLHLAELPKLLCFSNNTNVIELPQLMKLKLENLPHLTNIYPSSATSYVSSDISCMQSLFNKEDATPKLEKLNVYGMENLKEIWPPQFSISNLCLLRELKVCDCDSIEVLFSMDFGEIEHLSSSLRSITVERCDSVVKLFSCNPFPFLNNLQELEVVHCRSIQVLFDTDLGRAGKIEEQVCSSSLRRIYVYSCKSLMSVFPSNPMPLFNNLEELEVKYCASIEVILDIMGCVGETDKVSSSRLRSINLEKLEKLREVWRIEDAGNNLILHGFEAVESIYIYDCERFENIITPATTNFEMRALKEVTIIDCGGESETNDEMVESKQDQEIDVVSIPGKELNDDISKVAFPYSYLLHTFHHLHNLFLRDYKAVEVVFEIMCPSSRDLAHDTQQPLILPYLEELVLTGLERMSHVWKCNWNEFLILQKPHSQSSFHNLTTIRMNYCHSIKYLFSPLMAKLLSNLKKVEIMSCDGIEEVVSNRDDEDASIYSHTTTTFFPHLDLLYFYNLKNFKCIGGGANGISTDIHDQLKFSQASWSWSLCQYAREMSITDCDALSSVIPWYAVGQMQKLQVLEISDCKSMTEVFETQEINNKSGIDTGKSLPRLEYIMMLKLPKLKILKIQGCDLLKHIFTFSTLESLAELEELEIKDCEAMEVIVNKQTGDQKVVFPHLKSLILVDLPNLVGFFLGKNEFTWTTLEKVVISECPQITVFTYGQSTAPKLKFISTSLGKHSVECGLNFHVMTTSHQTRLPSYESTSSYCPTTMERLPWSYHNLIEMDVGYNLSCGQTLFSSDKLLQLKKLDTIRCIFGRIEEIFDSQTVAEIPNLRQVDLEQLSRLKYIWKSKHGTVLKFPNLTRLSIQFCNSLECVFTCSMVGSILQLQELNISNCKMKVIVKGEEECDVIGNATVVFPCLKSLKLEGLSSLEGFCLGNEAFEFPSLDTLQITRCSEMRVFTKGDLSAPKLFAINSIWGRKLNIHNRLNSFMNTSPSL